MSMKTHANDSRMHSCERFMKRSILHVVDEADPSTLHSMVSIAL